CSRSPTDEPFWSCPEALPNAPFEASVGTSFGNFRRVPRVPKATPRDPSVLPSESATCPESHIERPFGPTFGECHVSPSTPSRENPSECRPSSPPVRVPKPKQTTLRKFSERDTCPRVPKRTPHPGAL